MPKALGKKLQKFRRQEQDKSNEWQGRVNYHSPRSAESWESPDRLLSFDGHPGESAKKVMEAYRQQLLTDRGIIKPSENLKQTTQEATVDRAYRPQFPLRDGKASRLSPFEEAFRVSPNASPEEQGEPSWLKRLFSRK